MADFPSCAQSQGSVAGASSPAITLTINSSTLKEFSIPPHKTAFGDVALNNPQPGKVYVFVVSGP
jgi:hypothetical protein